MVSRDLKDKICLKLCEGKGGKCQRYPSLSATCDEFMELLEAYQLGLAEGFGAGVYVGRKEVVENG